jgi:hypothetical protein
MKLSKPPAIATWLLEHLGDGVKNEALTGDLLEDFCYGRSAGWYWRQVVVALFASFWKRSRILWVGAGFTIVWICLIDASSQWLIHISRSHLFEVLFSWGLTFAWPLSEVYAITFFTKLTALPLLISLSIYLGITKRVSLRAFARTVGGYGWICICVRWFDAAAFSAAWIRWHVRQACGWIAALVCRSRAIVVDGADE